MWLSDGRGTKNSKRLRSSLREGDFLARLGADEFVVVHHGITRPEEAGQLAKRLSQAIGEPYLIEGHTVVITASAASPRGRVSNG